MIRFINKILDSKYTTWVLATVIVGIALFFLFGLFARPAGATSQENENKVTICHANEGNGYNSQSINKNGNASGHDNHDGDIIPPFEYSQLVIFPLPPHFVTLQYEGKNWDEEGQVIYRNECAVPEEETDYCDTLEGVQKEDEDCPEVTPTPTVVVTEENPDKCPNNDLKFAGIQTEVPQGVTIDDKGNCVDIT